MIKQLRYKLIITAVILLYGLVIYFIPLSCPILALTGIPCPGCGMTRAFAAVLRMDFQKAYEYHRMFWSVPFLYVLFLCDGKVFRKKSIDIIIYILIVSGFVYNWIKM